MKEIQELIAKDLLSIKAVFFRPDEPFTWASGIKSPIYCDNRLILTAPESRDIVEKAIAETVKNIPLERILLETDSPYLTPVPFRGKRNESAYIPHIASRLSELTGRPMEEVAWQTTENAQKLFNI